jgi:hypothetical protein
MRIIPGLGARSRFWLFRHRDRICSGVFREDLPR